MTDREAVETLEHKLIELCEWMIESKSHMTKSYMLAVGALRTAQSHLAEKWAEQDADAEGRQ